MNRNWYAVYTKAQSETKVVAQLLKKRIENFCPHKRMIVGTGSKKRMIYEPLFPAFVFVNITEIQMYEVRKTSDVINFVYWLGRPAVIKTEDIESIAQFNGAYYNIHIEKSPVNAAGRVKFSSEPALLQTENRVLTLNNTRVKLNLPSLGYSLYAETNIDKVTVSADFDEVTTRELA
jgi:transcription antitermination factor NusG